MGQDAAPPPVSGWEKVVAATLVAVAGLVMLNLSIWRRLRAARRSQSRIEMQNEP